MKTTFTALLALLLLTPAAKAEITVYDHDGYTFGVGGFIEMDTIFDTTRSLPEVAGNNPVARKSTFDGENSRMQFSMRNTRLAFSFGAPEVDGWKSRAYLETDFLGYDPSVSATQSESAFYTNPALRIRHAYIAVQKDSIQILVGQTWTLFGWQPQYVLSSISVSPDSGTLYQRTPRIGATDSFKLNDTNSLDVGLSFVRPTQRDGTIPNVDFGVLWANDSRKSGFSSANSDMKTKAMSVGLSGTFREFEAPTSITQRSNNPAWAGAADVLLPILASSDGKDTAGTLTLTGEFTAGRGYGDEFPGFSGGLAQQFASTQGSNTIGNNVDLDAGLGGYNTQGGFELVKLRTWNTQLQYFPCASTFVTVGYGQLFSSNMGDFKGGVNQTASKLYDRSESYFANVAHDFTKNLRLAFEVAQYSTHYVSDGAMTRDNRAVMAAYYRF